MIAHAYGIPTFNLSTRRKRAKRASMQPLRRSCETGRSCTFPLSPQLHRLGRILVLAVASTMAAWVTLVSDVRVLLIQDGYRFVIDRSWAELSGTIKTMLSMDAGGRCANSRRFLGGRERRVPAPDSVGDGR